MDKTKGTFFQRGPQSGPWVHDKMFSMPNLQGNKNKTRYRCWNGYHQDT